MSGRFACECATPREVASPRIEIGIHIRGLMSPWTVVCDLGLRRTKRGLSPLSGKSRRIPFHLADCGVARVV